MSITKNQQARALDILYLLRVDGVPEFVTPSEASRICETFGVTNDKFRRAAKDAQHSRPVSRTAVAVEVVVKTTAAELLATIRSQNNGSGTR